MLIDLHLHSDFSIDAENSLEEMVEKAVALGLSAICFTEHLEFGPGDQGYGFFKPAAFLKAIEEAREKYQGEIIILSGVEFSEPHNYKKEFQETAAMGFDMIMAAVHSVDQMFFSDQALLEKYTPEEVYSSYYRLVLAAVQFGGFDVLAHLDFPKRYIKPEGEDRGVIEEILQTLIQKDIALEINTSLLRKGREETMPEEWILKFYAELGGKKVTIGSDAHRVGELGSHLEAAVQLVKKYDLTCGYYKNRRFHQVF